MKSARQESKGPVTPGLTDVAAGARVKPLLRGVSHELAVSAALLGWVALFRAAQTRQAAAAASVYGASLAAMFGLSALYHRPTWPPAQRRFLRRLDHAAIFLLIAGTYTPLCLALPQAHGVALLGFVWTGAVFGMAQAVMYPDAPKYLVVPIYLGLGWAIFPLSSAVRAAVGTSGLALLAAGGIVYSVGALIYWARRPDPFPRVFGYHEIFHLLVIAAAACHYAVVLPVVRALR
ncbi:MAG TPA: hemolysin III family protein [Anaeromyxobacteraceae bacterium]|nr:hemolysin III family protein [Anaeromyxobacteraceae bacterium]